MHGSDSSRDIFPCLDGTYERCVAVDDCTFKVPARYCSLQPIGKGSYGLVCKAVDTVKGIDVAIKKIFPVSEAKEDTVHFLREIRIMRSLGMHENIISLLDLQLSEEDDTAYIVMDLLDSDLFDLINTRCLSEHDMLGLMYQLIKAVSFIHDSGIVHRDLKPENVLVTRKLGLQVADFGQARVCCDDDLSGELLQMTEHAVTRWYRPPELMLSPNKKYGPPVDMWSVGCIFAEMLGRKPLFPGTCFIDQLSLIINVVGAPNEREISHIRGARARKFLSNVKDEKGTPLCTLFPNVAVEALDLLQKLLIFNPAQRITAHSALNHPYFESYRKENISRWKSFAEPCCIDFDFEYKNCSKNEVMKLVLNEILYFKDINRPLKLHDHIEHHQDLKITVDSWNHENIYFGTLSTTDCNNLSRDCSDVNALPLEKIIGNCVTECNMNRDNMSLVQKVDKKQSIRSTECGKSGTEQLKWYSRIRGKIRSLTRKPASFHKKSNDKCPQNLDSSVISIQTTYKSNFDESDDKIIKMKIERCSSMDLDKVPVSATSAKKTQSNSSRGLKDRVLPLCY